MTSGAEGIRLVSGVLVPNNRISAARVWRSFGLLLIVLAFLNGCAGLVGGKNPVDTASFALSPATLNFGKVGVGQKASQTVTVTNTGTLAVTIQAPSFSGPQFSLTGASFPLSLAVGQSATFKVWVAPTSAGANSGTFTIQGDGGSSPFTVSMTATASNPQPQLVVSPAAVDFGTVTVGTKATSVLTLSNNGSADLTISLLTLTGSEFGISGIATPKTISAGQSVPVTLSYSPTAASVSAGSLTITSNDPTTPTAVVSLSGTGTNTSLGRLAATPASVSFGNVTDGKSSSQTVTISNSGQADVHVTAVQTSGAGFSASGLTAPVTLTPNQTVNVQANFAPTVAGAANGTISITSDASNANLSVALSGTGVAAPVGQLSANPASVSIGNVAIGTISSQNFTVSNSGQAAVNISQISASGSGFSVAGAAVPLSLNPGQSVTLKAGYTPAVAGAASGSIAITSDASNSTLTVPVTATGVQAGLNVSPASYNFGSVVDGQAKSQSFTLTNTGAANLTVTQIAPSGAGFSLNGVTTPLTIAPGQSSSFTVQFAPTTAGALSGSVSIISNAPNSPNTIALSGTGVAATVTVTASPSNVTFGSIKVGSARTQNVSITNSGNASVTLNGLVSSGKDISVSGLTIPVTLTPSQSVNMAVKFAPSASENVSGNVTLTDAQGNSTVVPVSGSGVQGNLTLTPSSFAFGNVSVGSSNSQTVQLGNNGNGVLTVSQISVTGAGFGVANVPGLPISLNPGQTSSFNVQFTPAAAGSVSGSLTITSDGTGSPAVLPLSGTGVSSTQTLSFSSLSLNFGNVNNGSSANLTETITNSGNANVQITQITAAGTGFSLGSGAGTPVTLSPGQSLQFSVVFSPATAGNASGSVTVTSNATGSPATITLAGVGVQPSGNHYVTLTWGASPSNVVGYNLYRSNVSGSGYAKINSLVVSALTYDDSAVQSGATYYYVATAVDANGVESDYSNEASALIP